MRDISFVLEMNMSGIKIGEENAYNWTDVYNTFIGGGNTRS